MSRAPRPTRAPRGHALLEPLVAVALLAVVLAVGAPPLVPVVERAVASDAAATVASVVLEARARAIASGRCHHVHVDDDDARATLVVARASTAACDDAAHRDVVWRESLPRGVHVSMPDPIPLARDGALARDDDSVVYARSGAMTALVRVAPSGLVCVERGPAALACEGAP